MSLNSRRKRLVWSTSNFRDSSQQSSQQFGLNIIFPTEDKRAEPVILKNASTTSYFIPDGRVKQAEPEVNVRIRSTSHF